ncbi:MAG: hypothetical protein JNJ88_17470 [Planctomycetes bacterium]|nr:hypothetical protein [Planctomycetota bacterium]
MWADLSSGQTDQTTTYNYGTAKRVAAGDSKIATGYLLQKVTYPDDGVGDRGYVLYAYNAQGQVIWTEDQATNVLENFYDTAGRETARWMIMKSAIPWGSPTVSEDGISDRLGDGKFYAPCP